MKQNNFIHLSNPEPHRLRTKEILKNYPDIRNLIGKNPSSFFIIIAVVALQITAAIILFSQPWWAIILTAYLFGAFADHALFVMIHECTHKLLFKNPGANILAGIFANIPQVFPSAVSFSRYHLKHHSFQGVHELDGDLPNKWEAKLINNYFIGKVFWLLFYPLFQFFRLSRLKEIKTFDRWMLLNYVVQIVFISCMWYFFGVKPIVYLILSLFFSVGLHPLGARWIQEHYVVHKNQETYSYYGILNTVSFNVGYHNEHHDFPSVPWNKLPQIKHKAGPYYTSLVSHSSWTKLFFRFLFDREISLYSRITRSNRGKVKLIDETKPDVEIINYGHELSSK
ncbi:MAG TPA: fatty acid desaturase [Chitinophagaceae bacterium]